MCVIELDVPTGFGADLEGPFTDIYQTKKSEIRNSKTVVLYYDEVTAICQYRVCLFTTTKQAMGNPITSYACFTLLEQNVSRHR